MCDVIHHYILYLFVLLQTVVVFLTKLLIYKPTRTVQWSHLKTIAVWGSSIYHSPAQALKYFFFFIHLPTSVSMQGISHFKWRPILVGEFHLTNLLHPAPCMALRIDCCDSSPSLFHSWLSVCGQQQQHDWARSSLLLTTTLWFLMRNQNKYTNSQTHAV